MKKLWLVPLLAALLHCQLTDPVSATPGCPGGVQAFCAVVNIDTTSYITMNPHFSGMTEQNSNALSYNDATPSTYYSNLWPGMLRGEIGLGGMGFDWRGGPGGGTGTYCDNFNTGSCVSNPPNNVGPQWSGAAWPQWLQAFGAKYNLSGSPNMYSCPSGTMPVCSYFVSVYYSLQTKKGGAPFYSTATCSSSVNTYYCRNQSDFSNNLNRQRGGGAVTQVPWIIYTANVFTDNLSTSSENPDGTTWSCPSGFGSGTGTLDNTSFGCLADTAATHNIPISVYEMGNEPYLFTNCQPGSTCNATQTFKGGVGSSTYVLSTTFGWNPNLSPASWNWGTAADYLNSISGSTGPAANIEQAYCVDGGGTWTAGTPGSCSNVAAGTLPKHLAVYAQDAGFPEEDNVDTAGSPATCTVGSSEEVGIIPLPTSNTTPVTVCPYLWNDQVITWMSSNTPFWDTVVFHSYPLPSNYDTQYGGTLASNYTTACNTVGSSTEMSCFNFWMQDENGFLAYNSTGYIDYLESLGTSGMFKSNAEHYYEISEYNVALDPATNSWNIPSGTKVNALTSGTVYGGIYSAEYVARMSKYAAPNLGTNGKIDLLTVMMFSLTGKTAVSSQAYAGDDYLILTCGEYGVLGANNVPSDNTTYCQNYDSSPSPAGTIDTTNFDNTTGAACTSSSPSSNQFVPKIPPAPANPAGPTASVCYSFFMSAQGLAMTLVNPIVNTSTYRYNAVEVPCTASACAGFTNSCAGTPNSCDLQVTANVPFLPGSTTMGVCSPTISPVCPDALFAAAFGNCTGASCAGGGSSSNCNLPFVNQTSYSSNNCIYVILTNKGAHGVLTFLQLNGTNYTGTLSYNFLAAPNDNTTKCTSNVNSHCPRPDAVNVGVDTTIFNWDGGNTGFISAGNYYGNVYNCSSAMSFPGANCTPADGVPASPNTTFVQTFANTGLGSVGSYYLVVPPYSVVTVSLN